MRVVAAVLLFSCSAAAWSCGGAAPQKAGDVNVSSGSTVEGAEAELDRAEASLQRLFGIHAEQPDEDAIGGDHPASPDRLPSDAPPSQPVPPPRPGQATAPTTLSAEGAGSCETACDALASMRRASDRICVLAASDSPDGAQRCDRARARLARATQRVATACPECES